jgi:hypothetical protein
MAKRYGAVKSLRARNVGTIEAIPFTEKREVAHNVSYYARHGDWSAHHDGRVGVTPCQQVPTHIVEHPYPRRDELFCRSRRGPNATTTGRARSPEQRS